MTSAELHREKLLDGLRQTVTEVMNTMAWSEVVFAGMNELSNFVISGHVLGLIHIHGQHNGIVSLTTDQSLANEIVSRITGLSVPELTQEDLLDGIAELVNMICGGMKTKAQIPDISLSPPMAIVGESYTAQWKTGTPTMVLTFRLEEYIFEVQASI